ncbi:secretion protein HlyD [Shewanella sp. OPT22]|nr:secretion protein HlyD [Shewanella sp. OPT22]
MKFKPIFAALLLSQLSIASGIFVAPTYANDHEHNEQQQEEVEKGPNRGHMLRNGDFAIELAIFENGVPPEFRIFATQKGKVIPANDVKLNVKLTRLGDVIDDITFKAEGAYARGDMVIYEPHSFNVTLTATYQGKQHQWSYDNYEGRVKINNDVAKEMDITIEKVGPQTLHQIVNVYGKLEPAPNATRDISARFPGEVQRLFVVLGDKVEKGQKLMTIVSNDSLQPYTLVAPMSGIVTQQNVNIGEQSGESSLLQLTDTSKLIATLNVYPQEQNMVKPQQSVAIKAVQTGVTFKTSIKDSLYSLTPEQAKVFRAEIDNSNSQFSAGQFISAKIDTTSFNVPLAVKKVALQSFRDFTVVYTKVNEQYEVRMLELGRESGPWVEVINGIKAGADYAVGNSYLIKADIDKSGASHDH